MSRPVHAGYQLSFSDEILDSIYIKIMNIVAKMPEERQKKLLKKSYCRGVYDTDVEKIARSLLEIKRQIVISAQIHISKDIDAHAVQNWYDDAMRHHESIADDAKTAFVKRIYVNFDEGIVAFMAYIRGKPLYFTLTNYSAKTLQQIKKCMNSMEFVQVMVFTVPLEPYIIKPKV